MINALIRFSVANRLIVLLLVGIMAAGGAYSLLNLPIDAVPDITNVQVQINEIIHSSDIIQDMLAAKQIGIVGGIYNLSTGEVRFLPETYML